MNNQFSNNDLKFTDKNNLNLLFQKCIYEVNFLIQYFIIILLLL